jgi:hypothetical protein
MEKSIKLVSLLEDMEEGSAFDYAALQAKKAGKDSFKLGDKEFPVKEQDQLDDDNDRFMDLGGLAISRAVENLIDDGFSPKEILQFVKDALIPYISR